MKIGIFDSGLGGLFILKSIIKKMPQYDYFYLGDTKRMPYGNRSKDAIYQFSEEAVDYLFKQNCQLIIFACNSASSFALRKIQREYLPKRYPDRRVLGVVIPTIEEVFKNNNFKRIGVLATPATVASKSFVMELEKINPKAKVFQKSSPLLVPLIENNGLKWVQPILKEYLKFFIDKKVDCIILGCTHYPILKDKIRKIIGNKITIISQDELIPSKLQNYLERHKEINNKLTKNGKVIFGITDITDGFSKTAKQWFGQSIKLKYVRLD